LRCFPEAEKGNTGQFLPTERRARAGTKGGFRLPGARAKNADLYSNQGMVDLKIA
jgi:hypothetical protein